MAIKLFLFIFLSILSSRSFATDRCESIFLAEKKAPSPTFLSQMISVQNIKTLKLYQSDLHVIEKSASDPLKDEKFRSLISKTFAQLLDKGSGQADILTPSEWRYVAANSQRIKVIEGLFYYQALIEAPIRLLNRYSQYMSTRGGGLDFVQAPTVGMKMKHLVQSLYNGPLKYMLLVPTGVDLPGGVTPTQVIFKKLWKNPQYQPTSAEWIVLKEYKSDTIFKERQDFLRDHRTWVQIRRWGDYALNGILAVSVIQAFNWFQNLSEPEATVDAINFLNHPRHQLGPGEVRVYNETVPFPHMAIEIDGLVYSYGQTHMTVKAAREYIMSEVIEEGLGTKEVSEDNLLQKTIQTSGLNRIERVLQMARINIGSIQKGKLKRYLEMQTGKRYRNHTLALDCASMIVKALNAYTEISIPAVIDPSPSQVMMYLGSLFTLKSKNQEGSLLVTEVRQVRVPKSGAKKSHLWRNLYINLMETRLFWSFAHYSAAQRTYLELRYGSDGIQYWDQETLDYFKVWEEDIRKDFEEKMLKGQLAIFKENLHTKDLEMKVALKTAMDGYFRLEIEHSKEILESNNSRFEDVYRTTVMLALLQQVQISMYREAGFEIFKQDPP